MDWSGLADKVGQVAPMAGQLLLGAPGGAIGSMLASALGTQNDPDAIDRALEADPESAMKVRQMELDNKRELQALLIADKRSEREAETARQAEINKTYRAELTAESTFKSGWRPMIGYTLAFVFGVLGICNAIGLVYCVIHAPAQIESMVSLTMVLIGAMGAVLGVNIGRRSNDKQAAMTGEAPTTLMQGLADRLAGKAKARGGS